MRLDNYNDRTVRITLLDGYIFEGKCIHNSREYNLHEFGRDEEALQIDDWLFYESEILKVEEIENNGRFIWQNAPQHMLTIEHDLFVCFEVRKKIPELQIPEDISDVLEQGDIIRVEDASDDTEVLRMMVKELTQSPTDIPDIKLELI